MESNNRNPRDKNLTLQDKLRRSVPSLLLIISLIINPLPCDASEPLTIAITQIVEHPSLDKAKQGIIDELKANGYDEKNLRIIEENAQGNISTASLIAKKLVSQKPAAIITISTASTQSVVKASQQSAIPIIFSSVTDPVSAGIVPDVSSPHPQITGAMDFPPLKQEIKLIRALVPKIKKLGVLYNPSEANSVKSIEILKQNIDASIQVIEIAINNSNQVSQGMSALINQVDAVYIPSDNTVYSALPIVVKLSRKHKLPVFTSDPDAVNLGLLGCVGYSQYEVGRTAGKLAVKVLKGEKNLKIELPQKYDITINAQTAQLLGIQIPKEIQLGSL